LNRKPLAKLPNADKISGLQGYMVSSYMVSKRKPTNPDVGC
jgi:hypothetical protein